jgi:hypothetical protein
MEDRHATRSGSDGLGQAVVDAGDEVDLVSDRDSDFVGDGDSDFDSDFDSDLESDFDSELDPFESPPPAREPWSFR